MDFFEYASFASVFANKLWVQLLVGGLCFAIVYIFQAVALFVIAGREGYRHRWMAFVPFFNTYFIGVCGQKNRTFKSVDTKILALSAAILEFILFVAYIVYYAAFAELSLANCIHPYTETNVNGWESTILAVENVPDNLKWAEWCFNVLYNANNQYLGIIFWVDLVFLFLQVLVLAAFFQTYASRRYMIYTITSVLFPIQGILFFVLRNNRGMNYREFLRREQERQYRMYQQYQQQNFNQNPYNQNPYSRNPYNGYPPEGSNQNPQNGQPYGNGNSSQGSPEDPFAEFNGGNKNGGDPFDNGNNFKN